MIQHVQQQLEAMRAQERALERQIVDLTDQLTMTRGAVQVLEHVLNTYEPGGGDPLPAPVHPTPEMSMEDK